MCATWRAQGRGRKSRAGKQAMAGGGRCVVCCCEPDSALATSGRCMSAPIIYNPNLASFLFSFLVPPNRITQESLTFYLTFHNHLLTPPSLSIPRKRERKKERNASISSIDSFLSLHRPYRTYLYTSPAPVLSVQWRNHHPSLSQD